MPKPAQSRGKNYSDANLNYLLDIVEENLPCESDEWNEISLQYNAYFGGKESRSGEDLKNKFKALKATKKPTGDPKCPPAVRRAKLIQKAMESRMDVQTLDSGDENRDADPSTSEFEDDNEDQSVDMSIFGNDDNVQPRPSASLPKDGRFPFRSYACGEVEPTSYLSSSPDTDQCGPSNSQNESLNDSYSATPQNNFSGPLLLCLPHRSY